MNKTIFILSAISFLAASIAAAATYPATCDSTAQAIVNGVGGCSAISCNTYANICAKCCIVTPTVPTTSVTATSNLTSDQVSSIIRLIQSFGADAQTIANVKISLGVGSVQSSETASSLSYTWNKDIYYGMENSEDVKALQKALTAEGVYTGPITGNFYNLTKQGVIDFQKKHNFTNIPNTGYVGSYTRQVLNELYSK